MQISEYGSLLLHTPVCTIGFVLDDSPFQFWVALRNGSINAFSQLQVIETFDVGIGYLDDVIYDEDSKTFICIGDEGFRLIDVETKESLDFQTQILGILYKIAAFGSTKFFVGGSHEALYEIEINDGNFREITRLGENTFSISVHRSLPVILYSSGSLGSYTAVINDLNNPEETIISTLEMQKVRSAFSPDGSKIIQLDKYIRCFSFPDLNLLWCFSETEGMIKHVDNTDWEASCSWSNPVFTPDARYVFCGSPTGRLYIFDLIEGKLIQAAQAYKEGIEHLAISSNLRVIISIDSKGLLKHWQLEGLANGEYPY